MITDPVALGAARDAFFAARCTHHAARLAAYPVTTDPALADLATRQRARRDALVQWSAFVDTLETFLPLLQACHAPRAAA